jgi:hypothetical protein
MMYGINTPRLSSSYVPRGAAQEKFCANRTLIGSCMTAPQHSSVIFVSLRFHSRQGRIFKHITISIFVLLY